MTYLSLSQADCVLRSWTDGETRRWEFTSSEEGVKLRFIEDASGQIVPDLESASAQRNDPRV